MELVIKSLTMNQVAFLMNLEIPNSTIREMENHIAEATTELIQSRYIPQSTEARRQIQAIMFDTYLLGLSDGKSCVMSRYKKMSLLQRLLTAFGARI